MPNETTVRSATRYAAGILVTGLSSLVRSGLIPSLHSGFMVAAGSSWRIATLRPGEDPLGYLAAAANAPAPHWIAAREQGSRLRARTPAWKQARHEVAVNFTTD